MIIWSPSHVYVLFIAVFVANLHTAIMDCRIGAHGVGSIDCGVVWWFTRGKGWICHGRRSGDSGGWERLIWKLWRCRVRETVFLSRTAACVAVIVP
jgi:hypothetical protein